jgi:peptidoglycan/xylan/chitin deacetylase (PgdA/CDA1 family)
MRIRGTVAAAVAAFGALAIALSGCGAQSTAPTLSSAAGAAHQPHEQAERGPDLSGTMTPGSTSTPTTSTSPATSTQPGSDTQSGNPTTGNPADTGPLTPDNPRAEVIVGRTEHTTGGKHIALTFDDGPDPAWTPQVLALLAQYHAQATFCLIGNNVVAHPALVRQIVAAGDTLCDHTMTHDENLPSRPVSVRHAEIARDQQAIQVAAPGARVRYYRAPGGAFSPKSDPDGVQRIAAGLGMQPLAWSIDTVDWTKPGVARIVAAIESAGTDDVILLHDAGGDRSQTLAALRVALPWLVANGYQFDLPA